MRLRARSEIMKGPVSILHYTLLASSVSVLALTIALPSWGQQPSSPLAAVSAETKQYPAGNRLRTEYDTPNQPLAAPAAGDAARPAVLGLAAATRVQATLPEGFTLLPGTTRQIGSATTRANAVPSTRAAATPAAPSNDKFITVHPLAY